MLEVQSLEVGELKHDMFHKLPYQSKFCLRTIKRDYFFYAKSIGERDIWMMSFTKVIKIVKTSQNELAFFNMRQSVDISHLKKEVCAGL